MHSALCKISELSNSEYRRENLCCARNRDFALTPWSIRSERTMVAKVHYFPLSLSPQRAVIISNISGSDVFVE